MGTPRWSPLREAELVRAGDGIPKTPTTAPLHRGVPMATNSFLNGKHPRYFTAEEGRERFLASRVKALVGEPINADDSTAWHEVDEPLTSQQRKLITDAMPERGRCLADRQ
jgi:hypothetical protein